MCPSGGYMESRIVNKKFFNKLKIHSINSDSVLYINEEDLIKAPYCGKNCHSYLQTWNNLGIEKVLDSLSKAESLSDSGYYVLPKYSLYTSKIETSNYKGYGMNYLRNYSQMCNSIESNNYTHSEKLEICKRICDAITSLERYRFAYWDIHSMNVLINENKDIKLCDMDSVTPQNIYGELEYKKDLLYSYKCLTTLVLAILYGVDEMNLPEYVKNKRNEKFVKESPMFKTVIDEYCYMFYPDKYLNSFTEDYVEETRKILKKDNY